MNLLKKLPISYTGQLNQVRLINFSVDKEEAEAWLPWKIVPRTFNGRAIISMVDVQLEHMRPSFAPDIFEFNYRHIGFRLLVEDAHWRLHQRGELDATHNKGIYFIRSFTDKALIAQGGKLMTDYNLEMANIVASDRAVTLRQGEQFLHYALDEQQPTQKEDLKQTIGAIDRAYSVLGGQIRMVQIQREKWPIEWVNCSYFETNFFKTARLEGAFQVKVPIDYVWTPPQFL